jgi:hypothetical protein
MWFTTRIKMEQKIIKAGELVYNDATDIFKTIDIKFNLTTLDCKPNKISVKSDA